MKQTVIEKVLEYKFIAIVRGIYGEDCLNLARALRDGGIRMLEVTFDQSDPAQWQKTADTIRLLNDRLSGDMVFGAGTVTSADLVTLAKRAGAQFIVSPDVNEDVIRAAAAEGLVSMPGALTPTEVLTAHRCGADFVKLFPAGNFGPSYLKAICAPINHIRLLAVGGVNERNLRDFLEAGAVGAGVGGNLVNKNWIANREFDRITALAKEFTRQLS